MNKYNILSIQEELKDNIGLYKIIYGEHMTKISKIDLILQEMRQRFNQVNTRLDTLEKDVSILKKDVSQLKIDVNQIKKCPIIKQELISN